MLMTASRKRRYKIVATRPAQPVEEPSDPVPPVFHPNPDSLLPYLRCCRETCRATIPVGCNKCAVCGFRITSTYPLNHNTIYIEEF